MIASPLYRFLGLVFLILPAAFIVWHALASVLAAPAVWAAGKMLTLWLPDLVANAHLEGTIMVVVSQFGDAGGRIVELANADFQIGFQQDTRLLSYSIPFFAALHFATPMTHSLERFARSLLVLWILMTLGLVAVALKNLMVTLGSVAFDNGALPPAPLIALLYQFSVLIVPTVAPLCLWAWEARRLPAFQALLPPGLLSRQPPVDPG